MKRRPGKDKSKAEADIDIVYCALSNSHADKIAAAQTTYGLCISRDEAEQENALLHVPRSRALVFSSSVGLRIIDTCLTHGKSETRFVVAFKRLVLPIVSEGNLKTAAVLQRRSGCFIVLKDTDVTIILALAPCMRNMNVTNLLNESVTGLEALAATLSEKRIIRDMLESLYVMTVYDLYV